MLERLLSYVRRHRLLRAGDRVGVAVSGGADSVALLRLLLEARPRLGIVLAVVHFHHGIRGSDADRDQEFVAELAAQHGLEFFSSGADTPAYARRHKLSLEAAARELRYNFFRDLLREEKLSRLATAHTLDDQAETVLLRFLRGAWTRGLAGIYPAIRESVPVASGHPTSGPAIIRPLLAFRRAELLDYLGRLAQPWREDATNLDTSYARNRVRHELLPLLRREFNPGVDGVLSDLAELARGEEDYWSVLLAEFLPKLLSGSRPAGREPAAQPEPGLILAADLLRDQPRALQRRALRAALATRLELNLNFEQTETVLDLLGEPTTAAGRARSSRVAELPQGWEAVLRGRELRLQPRCQTRGKTCAYEYVLPVPGEVAIPPLGRMIRASLLPAGAGSSVYSRDQLLDPSRLSSELRIRNWRPGDRYWPARAKSPKKVKELLQQRHIVHPQKALWPVLVCGEEIIWIPGFPVTARFQPRNQGETAVAVEQLGLGERPEFGHNGG